MDCNPPEDLNHRLPYPWNFPGRNTGVVCHFLLKGTFLTQRLYLWLLSLLSWKAESLPAYHFILQIKNGDVDRICRRPPQGPAWFQLPSELVRHAKYGLWSVTEAISESSRGCYREIYLNIALYKVKQKNWCFWAVVLEKTLESHLDCKEIQPVHPKGDQSWVSIGRTDAEA